MKLLKKTKLNSRGVAHHYILPVLVIAALTFIGVRVYYASHAASNCKTDPSAAINATKAGGTWNGGGSCYEVQTGMMITTSNITMTNATFKDDGTQTRKSGGLVPIIKLYGTSSDTLSNISIVGGNTSGSFHGQLVGQAGIKLIATKNVTLNNININGTYGDCLEVFANPPKLYTPNTGLTVNNMTAVNCGRDGISPSDIANSSFNNVTLGKHGQAAIDFESDLNLGAGNVTISNSNIGGGVVFEEKLTGPINFNNDTIGGAIIDTSQHLFPYTITFNGGSFKELNPKGEPPLVKLTGPNTINFVNFTFARAINPNTHQPQQTPLWGVNKSGHLTFTNCVLPEPLGNPAPGVKGPLGATVEVVNNKQNTPGTNSNAANTTQQSATAGTGSGSSSSSSASNSSSSAPTTTTPSTTTTGTDSGTTDSSTTTKTKTKNKKSKDTTD